MDPRNQSKSIKVRNPMIKLWFYQEQLWLIKNTLLHSEKALTNTKWISNKLWSLTLVFILELTLIYTKGPSPTGCLMGFAQYSSPNNRTDLIHISPITRKPKPQIVCRCCLRTVVDAFFAYRNNLSSLPFPIAKYSLVKKCDIPYL